MKPKRTKYGGTADKFRPYVLFSFYFFEGMRIMRAFIGCSAKDTLNKKYYTLATNIADILAKRGCRLVFGGVDDGMMGKCFMTFKYHDLPTMGVADISDALALKNLEVDKYEVTQSTFRRTETMFKNSDMIVILPGGIGTFAEIFSLLDEIRTRKINKPFIIVNYNNYYTPLLEFISKSYKEGFISESDLKLIDVVTDDISFLKLIEKLNIGKESE